ncbi:exopolysaccharide Pel transporter PelG [Paenibacillus oenotherae]|uniref:Exopolysaccharide Pel transporter PelG n=1 Tax=Paenibacillus oenotherae TaxID=1435645 RepID=A0ABS7D4A1_9BACL|nr:exopolysaccharide Pel transporter PelG [Paenibacillus oenotherae]MBW7474745.1 exopolysaccharide Pel transporter PelG [Paenibacillus oenotherae]
MAGIGFELKKLYDKSGLVNKVKAFTYSSLVTIGPMLCCILLVSVVQWLLIDYEVSFVDRELFLACVTYAFMFSYIATNLLNMFVTRAFSDFIYQGYYDALLSTYHGSIKVNFLIGGVPAVIFLLLTDLPLAAKVALFLLYMTLITLWTQTIFVSAMKDYRKVGIAFLVGALLALLLVIGVLEVLEIRTVSAILFAIDIGFGVSAGMLFIQIERFFKTGKSLPSFSFFGYLRKYPSLIAIGGLTALGLYSHQMLQWAGSAGRLVGNTFWMAPEYDIAVFYAFISAIPTLIMFVVSLETVFYDKFRGYYDAILTRGSITDINEAKKGIYHVIVQQLTLIMGVQFFFSIMAVALGIRFLPFIGFTSAQIDVYNILVMGFFSYIIYSVLSLVLLYFDDRKGVLWLAAAFLVLNVGFSTLSVILGDQGFSFFMASFLTLLLTLWRLIYLLSNLDYFTFSAQPLVAKEYDNKYTRMLARSKEEE